MTPDELPGYLTALRDAVESAAIPEANAMAQVFQTRVQSVTLREHSHAPYTFYRATPGNTPAYASGRLARSIIRKTAIGGAGYGTASVAATAKYAAIQEFGGATWPNEHRYMHWRNPRPWWRKYVTIPEHPYMRPTVRATMADGSLSRSAVSAFTKRMSVFFH